MIYLHKQKSVKNINIVLILESCISDKDLPLLKTGIPYGINLSTIEQLSKNQEIATSNMLSLF